MLSAGVFMSSAKDILSSFQDFVLSARDIIQNNSECLKYTCVAIKVYKQCRSRFHECMIRT